MVCPGTGAVARAAGARTAAHGVARERAHAAARRRQFRGHALRGSVRGGSLRHAALRRRITRAATELAEGITSMLAARPLALQRRVALVRHAQGF